MIKLTPPIQIETTLTIDDEEVAVIATAKGYEQDDEDHASPWIESWSVRRADTHARVEYEDGGDDAIGNLLDAELMRRLAEESRP